MPESVGVRPWRAGVAAALLFAAGQAAFGQNAVKPAIVVQCTPTTVAIGGMARKVANPIASALEQAGPGSTIFLEAGAYPGFSIGVAGASASNARTSGGRPGQPITIEGRGTVWIRSGGGADTILVYQQVKNGHFLFKNLNIEPGYRAAVMFAIGGVHEGFRFWDCNIIGGYDHISRRGKASKWGVWGSQLKDFEFKGTAARAQVRNIRDEHGFYLQNCRGDVTIERVEGLQLGRTFCQITARSREGPAGTGTVLIRDCEVRDVALAAGDAYKGGFAFTFGGRHTGTIRLERNVCLAGFNKTLTHLTTKGVPYGTGALVMIDGGEAELNGALILEDNEFRFAPGCGDRAVVSIGGCRDLRVIGRNTFEAGAYGVALDLDPLENEDSGQRKSKPNVSVHLAAGTAIKGAVRIAGKPATEADLARLGLSR
ncbi:MAG: hypothetical protein HY812_12975 [Planctomycetes bacterium]|nr:hypothetical protein [Planctomycetota bacterium]